jgi:hypothetical protein
MGSRQQMWRSLAAALAILLLTGRGHSDAETPRPSDPAGWGFSLEWEYTGPQGTAFELCVDGTCSALAAYLRAGTTWRAPLPLLPQGEHRLVVRACIGTDCKPGTPDLVVRILPSSTSRPPIDIIQGPRIPTGRR